MGQAKSRGTFEERKAAALVLKAQREEAEAAERAERHRERRERREQVNAGAAGHRRRPPRMAPLLAAMLAAESIARMPK